MIEFLNKDIHKLLHSSPFNQWLYEETIDEDQPSLERYITFTDKGLEVLCDEFNKIQTIFIDNNFDVSKLTIVPAIDFSFDRTAIRNNFGEPNFLREPFTDEYLGKYGAWDRYDNPSYVLHFSYEVENENLKKITLMTVERAPSLD